MIIEVLGLGSVIERDTGIRNAMCFTHGIFTAKPSNICTRRDYCSFFFEIDAYENL